MIRFQRRSVTFGEVWFDERITEPTPDVLIVRHSRRVPVAGTPKTKLSLVTDLTLPEEDLWKAINRGSRRGIRRGQASGFLVTPVHRVKNDHEIAEFARFYEVFAQAKNLSRVDIDYLKAVHSQGRLWVSSVSQGAEVLAWNTYVVTGSTARSSYGASICHTTTADHKRDVAHAQRLLNWEDVLAFKALGFRTYDWGGLFSCEVTPGNKGINDFKRQFGGEEVEYFDALQPMTLRGHAYLMAYPVVDAARRLARTLLTQLPARCVAPLNLVPFLMFA